MEFVDFKVISLGVIICSLVFAADFLFGLGAISLLYIFFMMITFWLSKQNYYIISSVVISLILNIIGWMFQTRHTEIEINVGQIQAMMDYEGLFRVFTIFILIFVGGILIKQRNKEFELSKLNESLELRILARTTASEHRAKRLEQQIDILKIIQAEKTNASIIRLDNVINELKELNEMEMSNE
jgi:hypothetical protein